MSSATAPLYGLVLSGGRSTRMGTDKGLLEYHGVPQREYFYNILKKCCDRVFLSIRDDQEKEVDQKFNYIKDQNEYRGPFNGILSAHKRFPNAAWLVLACDLPLLELSTITQLVTERDPNYIATAFATSKTRLPEPLIAIWEPKSLVKALDYLRSAESSGPRKYLMNSSVKIIHPVKDQVLCNANSLEEYHFAKSKLKP